MTLPNTPSPRHLTTHVCVGDALVDLVVRVEALPGRGRTTWGSPPVRVAGARTGVAISLVEPDGERTFLACALGAAQTRLSDRNLISIRERPPQAVFLAGLMLLEEPARGTTLRFARWLGMSGATTFFDPNLRQPSATIPEALRDAMLALAAMASVVLAGEEEGAGAGAGAGGSDMRHTLPFLRRPMSRSPNRRTTHDLTYDA